MHTRPATTKLFFLEKKPIAAYIKGIRRNMEDRKTGDE
jgi:hypothetical protein